MSNKASRNHYLPQFYLESFYNNSGKVFRTFLSENGDLEEREYVKRATGYEIDLYTFKDDQRSIRIKQPDIIETDIFKKVDDLGSLSYKKSFLSKTANNIE